MSVPKAAPLTSSLLARKGAAKPAALNQDVYHSADLPAGPSGPTAVVRALHPAPAGGAAHAVDDGDAADLNGQEAAPEAALTDLRVDVDRTASDTSDAPAEMAEPEMAATESAPAVETIVAPIPEPAPEPEARREPEPERTAAADIPPAAVIAAAPTDRLVETLAAAPDGRPGRTLAVSAGLFVVSAVIGWFVVQQSPGLRAEFRDLASQIQALVYGPTADPAATEGDAGVPDVAAPTAPDASRSGETAPPAPESATPETTRGDEPNSLLAGTSDADDKVMPSPAAPEVSTEERKPSIDLVRLSPSGDGIIAGRAAPNAELILLDNDEPIGTVTATASGEWVFQTGAPLPGGGHRFGVVVKKAYGNVTLPPATANAAGDTPSSLDPADGDQGSRDGGDEDGALRPDDVDLLPPRPRSKPSAEISTDTPGVVAGGGRFMIQLASVKSTTHAERLWSDLKQDFPALTDGLKLTLDSRKVNGDTNYVRVRTGPFDVRANAEDYCARFKAGKQDCLVIVALPRS